MYRNVYALMLAVYSVGSLSQAPANIQSLFVQLRQEKTTNAAAREIRDQARKDPAARDFIAQRLPSMIKNRPTNLIWMNAVRLAGQLKVTSAIPALKDALSLGPIRGGYDYEGSMISLSEYAQLRYDIVGRALADIGEPCVPAVADVLSSSDASMRERAIFILSNIDSPAAQKALRDHLPKEDDPAIKQMIQNELHLSE